MFIVCLILSGATAPPNVVTGAAALGGMGPLDPHPPLADQLPEGAQADPAAHDCDVLSDSGDAAAECAAAEFESDGDLPVGDCCAVHEIQCTDSWRLCKQESNKSTSSRNYPSFSLLNRAAVARRPAPSRPIP